MPARSELLAEKLMDVANLAATAMMFGQLVSGQRFRIGVGIIGVSLWVLICCIAYFYLPRERE